MTNGIQKYLMIALGAVFLWGFSAAAYAQELERTILSMKEVSLVYKNDNKLLTKKHAKQLDIVIQHMRSKPTLQFEIKQSVANHCEIMQARIGFITLYLKDNGINLTQLQLPTKQTIICEGPCYGPITIREISK